MADIFVAEHNFRPTHSTMVSPKVYPIPFGQDDITETERSDTGHVKPPCYVVIGNHASYVGITETVCTLVTYFSRHYSTYLSEAVVPDAINVLIDEFSHETTIAIVRSIRESHPRTRFILLATEFITPIRIGRFKLNQTFNIFDPIEDWGQILEVLGYRIGVVSKPYLLARYQGFVSAMSSMDLVLCAHDAVADTMALLPAGAAGPEHKGITLYPEIDARRVANDERLYSRPPGVTMTGTLTSYRNLVASQMVRAFQASGFYKPVYKYIPFTDAPGLVLHDASADLGYGEPVRTDTRSGGGKTNTEDYLFNINPPQRANWRYSSPMRILRAIMLGQIPLLTRRFGDHPIELTALVFDGQPATAEQLWFNAAFDRNRMIDRYLRSVEEYSVIARQKNAIIDRLLSQLTAE